MRIGNRLFPYPVLHADSDDYLTATFDAKMNLGIDGPSSLRLSCIAALRSADLSRLIDEGKAAYAFHLECGATATRLCHVDAAHFHRRSIPITALNGRVERTAFVVATKPIENFSGADWNPDYQGLTFNLRPGSILAYADLDPLNVRHPIHEEGGSGIFTVKPNRNITDGIATVTPENNRIVIGLGEDEFREYERYAHSAQFVPMLRALILLPALTYLFAELQKEDGWDEWEDSEWLHVLADQYDRQGIDLKHEVRQSEKSAVVLAQECLASPVSAALASFPLLDGEAAVDGDPR